MITLFIDTSSFDVSIAVLRNNKLLNLINKHIPNEHSKYSVSYIDEVLKKSNINPKDVQHIVVVNGPGSFTGIRIGLTIAKVYAYLLDIEVTLVSSLKSLALSTEGDYILSIIDARNDNCYIGLYDTNYNDVIKEHFSNYNECMEILSKYDNVKVVSNSILNSSFDYEVISQINVENIVNYYQDKEKVNAHKVLPNYLKEPQAIEKNV